MQAHLCVALEKNVSTWWFVFWWVAEAFVVGDGGGEGIGEEVGVMKRSEVDCWWRTDGDMAPLPPTGAPGSVSTLFWCTCCCLASFSFVELSILASINRSCCCSFFLFTGCWDSNGAVLLPWRWDGRESSSFGVRLVGEETFGIAGRERGWGG